jgi:hypothetical protein
MSDLGGFGSDDSPRSPPDAELSPDVPPDVPKSTPFQNLHTLIAQGYISRAMKTIIALIAKGHHVTEFIPWVCQQMVSTDELIRHLA